MSNWNRNDSSWVNGSGYFDRTMGAALAKIGREDYAKNHQVQEAKPEPKRERKPMPTGIVFKRAWVRA